MQELLDSWMAQGYFAGIPYDVVYALGMLVFGLIVVLGFILNVSGVTTFIERRVWARIQSRVGPNRVGPQGILQWLVDGIKLLMKEDVIPSEADPRLFRMAPYVVVMGFVTTFVVLPFSSALVVADMNVGVIYITAVTALIVVGILMAGWASNNKWSLIGGIRSAAQIVSYEIPAGLSIFPIVLITGSLSMQEIIKAQSWAPHTWFVFHSPFTFVAFFILFTSALAEGNRTPFDLPEAESELVAGFVTEYSGVRYLMFFLVEWGNLYVIGGLLTTLFLGGWQVPPVSDNVVVMNVLQFVTFFVKSYFWVLVAMWIRATLPRIRVDQLMTTCWKYLVPMSFINLIGQAVWTLIFPHGSRLAEAALTLLGFVIVGYFFSRVAFHLRRARPQMQWSPLS
ncbi:MAG: NADH-quinone oxidoreductase subunit NuoH [Deltaproteobacteria bacterium]|nr:NADH-quinone oxidoreductase subunit NuoH [Deltaproteobacteria bacterium]MBI3388364.1 NADH-quinone oxidoreductase subunit NuoH [Deltaproteobacteria bacterium]